MIKMKLHLLMAQHRMSQKEVSEKTGIHAPTINKYYNDKAMSINIDHITKLCKLFNCTVGDLIEYVPDTTED